MLSALLVGLTSVDTQAYGGWDGRSGCEGSELDVINLTNILRPLNYQIQTLITLQATKQAVLNKLYYAAQQCQTGDTFVFYYSGHGGQRPDIESANQDETDDGQDETLVLYDGELIDDELNKAWYKFRAGVRIVMLSDSCNSGTNYRMSKRDILKSTPLNLFNTPLNLNGIRAKGTRSNLPQMKAQLLHLGGCRDGGTSGGWVEGGVFTKALCQTWNLGRFQGNYETFYQGIRDSIRSYQAAQFNTYGPVSTEFRNSRPFSAARSGTSNSTTVGTETHSGAIQQVSCMVEINAQQVAQIRTLLNGHVPQLLAEALDNALSNRPDSHASNGQAQDNDNCHAEVTISWS